MGLEFVFCNLGFVIAFLYFDSLNENHCQYHILCISPFVHAGDCNDILSKIHVFSFGKTYFL